MRTVVLDTNVLLSDPSVVFDYPDAEIIIPETVLGEIDKLKTSRVDPDLRFKGREISRILFELSESGSLVDGVELPDGGRLRVSPLESDGPTPVGLSLRNADDRILAVAHQACSAGCEDLTLVTNDLNMLLKAQTLGVSVERRSELDAGVGKRTVRWLQRYRVPITILAIAVAVFAGVLALSFYTSNLGPGGSAAVPAEFRDLLTANQRNLLDGLIILERNPGDVDALRQVGNAYYGLHEQSGSATFAQKGIDYYGRYLQTRPEDTEVRTDMAVLYFYLGSTDRAIQEATQVIEANADHIKANYNLGIFYWQGRRDYPAAAKQFVTVIDLASESTADPHDAIVGDEARGVLQQIVTEAAEAGVAVDVDPTYLPGGSI
jgi:hypothetical protein